MDRNPLDAHRDVFPYPYAWSRDFTEPVWDVLNAISEVWVFIDPWTYRNHWTFVPDPGEPRFQWVSDLYNRELGVDRGQMSHVWGTDLANDIIAHEPGRIRCLIWDHRIWTPDPGWHDWDGIQGDFVDHIHIEWNSEVLRDV